MRTKTETLLQLEERYLCSLMNGGDGQDIVLSEFHEITHAEIRRERDTRGTVLIHPKTVRHGESIARWNEDAAACVSLAGDIREIQKQISLGEAVKSVNFALPASEAINRLREELDKIAAETGRGKLITAEELLRTEFDNTEFIVDRILPVGLTVFSGAPKTGKSWLLLLLAENLRSRLPFLGFPVRQVPVLYYTLEDSARRCKYRLNKIGSAWSGQLFFREKAAGCCGLVDDIKATGARVAVVDTLGAFARIQDSNSYTETTGVIRELKEIADTMQVAVIVAHHSRKNTGVGGDWTNEIIGSQGIVGAADCVMQLQRKRGEAKATLNITGRDIADSYISMVFDDGLWRKGDV
jgi:hypothetical protein